MTKTFTLVNDWAWLDSISGKVDEDFREAVNEQPKLEEGEDWGS